MRLTTFLAQLSPATRGFSVYPSYDFVTASEICEAIKRFDKLRLVVETKESERIIALLEFSFGIPTGDMQRFDSYGIQLTENTDCRFGPCLADDIQDQGLRSLLTLLMFDIARRFGKTRVILWGGVFCENTRAIHFYKKHGFMCLGHFSGPE